MRNGGVGKSRQLFCTRSCDRREWVHCVALAAARGVLLPWYAGYGVARCHGDNPLGPLPVRPFTARWLVLVVKLISC